MDAKCKYREFANVEKGIPLFSKPWWLDSVAGPDLWDVIIIEQDNQIIACLPYVKKRIYLLNLISMPALTQKLGIWMKYPKGQKYTGRLAFEKEIITEIIGQLPDFDYFGQSFDRNFTNWLPFYWKGFEQTTKYTYVLEDLKNQVELFSDFRSNIKTDIRKAQKHITVYSDEDIEKFYYINKMTFNRQNKKIPYSLGFLSNLDKAAKSNNCRKIFLAEDEEKRIHAAIYLVWDNETTYYIMGGADPELRSSGATSLLLWEGIKFAATITNNFDFEGSMIEPVERFIRAFGAKQIPYFYISKNNSLILKTRKFFNEVFK